MAWLWFGVKTIEQIQDMEDWVRWKDMTTYAYWHGADLIRSDCMIRTWKKNHNKALFRRERKKNENYLGLELRTLVGRAGVQPRESRVLTNFVIFSYLYNLLFHLEGLISKISEERCFRRMLIYRKCRKPSDTSWQNSTRMCGRIDHLGTDLPLLLKKKMFLYDRHLHATNYRFPPPTPKTNERTDQHSRKARFVNTTKTYDVQVRKADCWK